MNINGTPTTIEELKQWYTEHNLPPEETTRFFIGKNYTGAKAFGIYEEENGNFVVYKNKADSVRVIRYRGEDEAYAVNELYLRLKEEIANQKRHNATTNANNHVLSNANSHYSYNNNIYGKRRISESPIFYGILCIIIFYIIAFSFRPANGYYHYDNMYYYHQGWSWYVYDDGWRKTSAPSALRFLADNYYTSSYYYSYFDVTDFIDSDYYSPFSISSDDIFDSDSDSSWSSWDSDSSWDSSDSWDSGSTDWGSDW